MNLRSNRALSATAALAALAALAGASAAAAAPAPSVPAGYSIRAFASGGSLTNPDDVTRLGGRLYVAYQNATSATGTGGESTILAYRPNGAIAGRWTITGRVDGLAGDPGHNRIIATVNEDANSTLYTIDPRHGGRLRHYTYSPDPATLNGGGTDAVTVMAGRILISASNPSPTTTGGTVFAGPAAYFASIPKHGATAKLTPAFADNAKATDAVSGKTVTLNLSDPDSNATVPGSSPRFRHDFVLDSQGDSQLVFDRLHGSKLTVLSLSAAAAAAAPQVDDVRWADSSRGTLIVVDQKAGIVYAITGPFHRGTVFGALPSGGGALSGDLGTINLFTGQVEPFGTGFESPKGLLYLPGHLPSGQTHTKPVTHGKHHKHG